MKKKIFGAALIAAMAVAAGLNFNQSKNEVELTDLALANVEALAQGELSSGYAYKDCSNNWEGGMGGGMNHQCTCTGSGNILFCI